MVGQPYWEDSFLDEQDAQQEPKGAAGDLGEDVVVVADLPRYLAPDHDEGEAALDVRSGVVLSLWAEADGDVHHRLQEGHEDLGKIRAYFVEGLC